MKRLALAIGFDLTRAEQDFAWFPADAERLADLTARAAVVGLFSLMAMRFGADFMATGRLTGLLLLVSEALVVVLTVLRRSAAALDRSMQARILTAVSMLGPPLLQPVHAPALAPEAITVLLSIAYVSAQMIANVSALEAIFKSAATGRIEKVQNR